MKNMKIFLIIAMALVSASCDKWLDVKPQSQLDRDDLFSSENGYSDALIGVYAELCDESLYGRELTYGTLDIMAGCYSKETIVGNYGWLFQYLYKKDNTNKQDFVVNIIDAFWSKIYTQIANLNAMLQTIDDNKNLFSGSNYEVLKGEAIGLRAFLHFELLRMYGETYSAGKDIKAIPYVNELTTSVTRLYTVDEAITLILEDLGTAKGLLEKDPIYLGTTPNSILASQVTVDDANNIYAWHNRRFHFNYYAAIATMARVYLWKGDKTNALEKALEVISAQESKFPWVKSDNLLNIGSDNLNHKNQDATFATEHIFTLNATKLETLTENYLYKGSETSHCLLLTDRSVYPSSFDYRYKNLFKIMEGTTLYVTRKYEPLSNVSACFKNRIPIIRVSEMYYIAAECEGNTTTATGYLNTVRDNRGLLAEKLENLTPEQLKEEIFKEYQKEFYGEGQLWFYYKRNLTPTIEANKDYFTSTDLYTFDRPDGEDSYRF